MGKQTKLTIIKAEGEGYTELKFEHGAITDVFHLLAAGLAAAAMQFVIKDRASEAVTAVSMEALRLIAEGKSEMIEKKPVGEKYKLS